MSSADSPHAITINFGIGGNSNEFVVAGWSGAEPGQRWATGKTSTLKIPSFKFSRDALLSFDAAPYLQREKVPVQNLTVFFNAQQLDEFPLVEGRHRYSVVIPQASITSGVNSLELRHPNAVRPRDVGGGNEGREIAISFSSLLIEPSEVRLFSEPTFLPGMSEPEPEALEQKSEAQRFQSLGQNCEFGLFQRKCGAEPAGLFRFSSIFLPQLLEGLQNRFSGIGEVDNLEFVPEVEEYIGRHKLYGLDYHTFTKPGKVDLGAFTKSEAARLAYLARLLPGSDRKCRKDIRRATFSPKSEFKGSGPAATDLAALQ